MPRGAGHGHLLRPGRRGPNDITGTSVVRELRSLGIAVKYRRSTILEGIELIRRAIRSGDGTTRWSFRPAARV